MSLDVNSPKNNALLRVHDDEAWSNKSTVSNSPMLEAIKNRVLSSKARPPLRAWTQRRNWIEVEVIGSAEKVKRTFEDGRFDGLVFRVLAASMETSGTVLGMARPSYYSLS